MALAARGWSPQAIQAETGIPAQLIRRELDGRPNQAPGLPKVIASAYDRLWNRDPPTAVPAQRQAAVAAAAEAARLNWAPPMAWDDDLIDQPDGRPAEAWQRRGRGYPAVDLVEDAEFVREHGGYRRADAAEVAMRLGVSRDQLQHAYVRARRYSERAAKRPDATPEPEAEAG
jgi:hypothetical protein